MADKDKCLLENFDTMLLIYTTLSKLVVSLSMPMNFIELRLEKWLNSKKKKKNKTLAALLEDPGLILGTPTVVISIYTSSSRALFWLLQKTSIHIVYKYACRQNIHME